MPEKKNLLGRIEWAAIVWLARRLPDCKTMTRDLGRSLDQKPGIRERIVQRLHLFTCEPCRRYLEQIKFLKKVFRFREENDCGDESVFLTEPAKTRMKNRLRSSR